MGHTVLLIKVCLSVLAIFMNLLVIFFISCSKKFKDFMYRLILYLMATNIFQAVAIILISIPVTVKDDTTGAEIRPGNGWNDTCVGTAFVSMTSLWMGNIIIFCMVIYLVWNGWSLYRNVYRKLGEDQNEDRYLHQKPCSAKEIVCVVFLFIGPLAVASIPFSIDGGMYGISGLWCWIKAFHSSCGDLKDLSLTVVLIFFYVPLMLIVLLAVLSVVITFICCCRGEVRRHEKIPDLRDRLKKQVIIVLACPVLYCSVSLLLIINRIYSTVHFTHPVYPLWLLHAIADPARVLLPALSLVLNPYVWKDVGIICSCKAPTKQVIEVQGDSTGKSTAYVHTNRNMKDYGAVTRDTSNHKDYVKTLLD